MNTKQLIINLCPYYYNIHFSFLFTPFGWEIENYKHFRKGNAFFMIKIRPQPDFFDFVCEAIVLRTLLLMRQPPRADAEETKRCPEEPSPSLNGIQT